MSEIINSLSQRSVVAERVRGYLLGWICSPRIERAIFDAHLLTSFDLACIRKGFGAITDAGIARAVGRILSHRKVRRVVAAYEMKERKLSRKDAVLVVRGLYQWAAKDHPRPAQQVHRVETNERTEPSSPGRTSLPALPPKTTAVNMQMRLFGGEGGEGQGKEKG
jgi:hypothetical protein